MVSDSVTDADIAAYLRRIGLEAEPPSVEALQRLHRAQVEHVPYETAWIHLGEQWDIDPLASMRRVAHEGRGGYCYHLNGALSLLLAALGYRVTRHVGGVHGPEGPNTAALTNHLVLVVSDLPTNANPGGRWYVDAGLGDALHEPMPMLPATYVQPPMTFQLAATDDGVGDWHLTHDPAGSFTGMSFREGEVGMNVFAARHEYLSTSPESGFVRVCTVQRRHATGTVILRGCVVTRWTVDGTTMETISRGADWFAFVADELQLKLDRVVPEALDALWAAVSASHRAWLVESEAGLTKEPP